MSDPYAAFATPDPYAKIGKPADSVGMGEDVLRSAGAGLAHLAASLSAGLSDLPATVQAAAAGGQRLGERITGNTSNTDLGKTLGDATQTILNAFQLTPQSRMLQPGGTPVSRAITALVAGRPDVAKQIITARGPTSSQIANALPGGSYQPRSFPGKVAKTGIEFAPAAASGPGGVIRRGAQVLAPALASESAGALTEGTPFEGPARMLAAIIAGGAVAPRSTPTADVEALSTPESRVASVLNRNLRRDEVTPEALADFASANPGAPTFHAAGPNVSGLAEVAAQSPGKAQRLIRTAVLDDSAAAPGQARDLIGSALGGKGDYFASLDKAIQARRTAANAGMKAIEAEPVQLGPDAVMALRSDLAQGAVRKAAQNALGSMDPEVRASGANLNRLADQVLDNPGSVSIDLRSAQDISRSLKEAATSAFRNGDSSGPTLSGLAKAIRSNASDVNQGGVKGYAEWLARYGDDSDNITAMEMGRDVFSGSKNVSAEQIKRDLQGMSPAALDYYRKGVGEAVLDKVRKTGVMGLRQAMKDEYGDRIGLAFPDKDSFGQFMGQVESLMERHGRNAQVVGNSRTFGRQAAAEDLNAQQGIDPVDVGATIVEGALSPHTIPVKGLKGLLKLLPDKNRSIVGNPETNAILGHALVDPEEAQRILRLYQAQKGQQSFIAMPGRVAARALTTQALLPAALATRQGQ